MSETFTLGQEVRCANVFGNLAGTATDPTVVKFKVRTPGGTETEYVYGTDAEVVRTGTGAYYVDVVLDEATSSTLVWALRWVSSGNLVTASERHVRVRTSKFADPL